MSSTVSLPVLGAAAKASRVVVVEPKAMALVPVETGPVELHTIEPKKMVSDGGHAYWYQLPRRFYRDLPDRSSEVSGTLLENDQILGPPAQMHSVIRDQGGGRHSFWYNNALGAVRVVLSSSDGSDPRSNGKTYSVVNRSLSFANDWKHLQTRGWLNHSKGQYFLRRGGDRIPPPLFANLGITDICNLKCGICGSQNMPTPVNRRHMDYRVFSMVAETIFPLLTTVEFNSRGEPLIHPHIADMLETVHDYGIFLRLQTNGTQFQARRLQILSRMMGEVSISIDATGELFEYARTNGKWSHVDEGVRHLLKLRDPTRLGINIYPTLTAKTIEGAEALIRWAMEAGVDRIDFHNYDPIYGGHEQVPSAEQLDRLRQFASRMDPKHPTAIFLNYAEIKPGETPHLPYPIQNVHPNIPRGMKMPSANPVYTCMAPVQLVDIDLDGGVCVCCMLQDRKLGNALTVEAFADCWFGGEYQAVRESLKRSYAGEPLYETCRSCVKQYAGG